MMRRMMEIWRTLRSLPKRNELETGLHDEIRFHIDHQTERNLRAGMVPAEARRQALIQFGGIEPVREQTRDEFRAAVIENLARDVRFGWRALLRTPGFTAVAVVTLALGIGANSAVFSVVNAVLIRPLPYPDADRLVQVWETNPQANRWGEWASYPDFIDWNRDSQVFEGIGAFRYWSFRLSGGGEPEMLVGLRVSPGLLTVLGVNPILGRSLLPEEGTPGRNDVAIISHALWQRRFGADTRFVGKSIVIDDRSVVVVGVLPPGLTFPANLQAGGRAPDIWIPVGEDSDRGSHNYRVVARLKPGRTLQHARADMGRLAQMVADAYPRHRGRGGEAAALQAHTATSIRPALLILIGATLLVLIIACANIANLLLARSAGRTREISVHLALGAAPLRLLQQGLTESIVLAAIGGVAGLLVAFAGVRVFIMLGPDLPLVPRRRDFD